MRPDRPLVQPSRRALLGLLGTAPVAAGVVLSPGAPAAATPLAPSAPDRRARRVPRGLRPGGELDRFVERQAARDLFSGTLLVTHRSRPVLTRSYGMADKERSIPNREGTIFNVASVTKSFTSVAIAQLVQRGQVDFHEKLGTYLDGFPAEIADTVTIHQLLTHTSGMGNYPESPDFPSRRAEWDSAAEVMEGVMAIIRQSPLRFPPGTRHSYSNSGFFVLGAIVAEVSGQPYYDYVRQHVFGPAGMRRTDFYTRPQVLAATDIAHPYWTQPSGDRLDFTTSEHFGFIGGPADGAYCTVSDLVAFAQALQGHELLSPALTGLITSGKVVLSPTDPPPDPSPIRFYGYGYRCSIVNDLGVFGHSGGGPGRAANLDIHADLDWVVAVLGNYDTPLAPIVQLERELITRPPA
jgi:CubicO group peptidase (beta-lactamase class C family)